MAWPCTASPAALTLSSWGNCWADAASCVSLPGRTGSSWTAAPQDLGPLDQAIDEATDQATSGLGGPSRFGAALTEAGLFVGSVIVATVTGARWRLWPNGHPVVHLASGRDLDVAAMASDRVGKGAPRLADVYADAADPSR